MSEQPAWLNLAPSECIHTHQHQLLQARQPAQAGGQARDRGDQQAAQRWQLDKHVKAVCIVAVIRGEQ